MNWWWFWSMVMYHLPYIVVTTDIKPRSKSAVHLFQPCALFSTLIRSPPHICLILSGKLECLILQRQAVMVQMFMLSPNVLVPKLLVQKHVLVQERCHHLWCKYMFFWWNSATCTKTWCKYTRVPPPPATQASAQMTLHQSYRSSPPLSSSYRFSLPPLFSHLPPFFLHRQVSYHLDFDFKLWCKSNV